MYKQLSVPSRFLMKLFCCNFLYDTFGVKVRKIIPKLILHAIIYVYPHILMLWIKSCKSFRFFCDATYHKEFGLGMTAVIELRERMYFILDCILFIYLWLYGILWLVDLWCSFWFPPDFWWKYFVACFFTYCIPCQG